MTIGEQMYEVIHRTNAYGEDYDERAIAIRFIEEDGPFYAGKTFISISARVEWWYAPTGMYRHGCSRSSKDFDL